MKKIFNILIYVFAVIGFVLVLGYFAIRLHLTNSPGIIEGDQNRYLKNYQEATSSTATSSPPSEEKAKKTNRQIDLTWAETNEWKVLKEAIKKDASVFQRVEDRTGIPSRLIVAQLVVEQLRLYNTNREIFKQMFEPLKVLGSQSQFSWGVMGIKEQTAEEIENNLKNPSSPFYLGTAYEHMLDFKTSNIGEERFDRIISESDHYYSYLYTALCLKEIESQWQKAGFNILNRPEILSTLFNIGFEHSIPNSSPKVGGAEIDIDAKVYSFGGLAYDFYYSDELLDYFPRR